MKSKKKKTKAEEKRDHRKFVARVNEALSNGCCVVIYENTEFSGNTLRLSGPAEYANLKNLPGSNQDWGDAIGAIETGPHASITVFDDEDFGGDHIDTYGPNSRTVVSGDLDDNIDSIRINQA